MATFPQWLPWALLSAASAALTAIFARLGLQQVDADLAMLLRTIAIVAVPGLFAATAGKWSNPLALPGRTLLWLLLPALATGASWLCCCRAVQRAVPPRGWRPWTSSAWCWWRCSPSPSCTSAWHGANGWAWR